MAETCTPAAPSGQGIDIWQFLEARFAEDERWAHEASLLDEVGTEGGYVAGGVHWRWTDEHGNLVCTDPLTVTYLDEEIGGGNLLLESVETYQTSMREMPQLAVMGAYEVRVAIGVHIARHDPARVLAEVAAKRKLLVRHRPERDARVRDGRYVLDPPRCTVCTMPYPNRGNRQIYPCDELRLLAAPYCAHPDFDPAWRIDA